jgi:drug/metabolite transporter (DMT)-like permease
MKLKHWIVFILLGLIWSTSFLWIKIGVQEIGPMALVAFRTLFGAITVLVIALYQKEQWPRLAIPFFLISWGEQTIDSAVASILNATVPLLTIVIAHFWLSDDKITLQKALGLSIGFGGVVLLLSRDLSTSAHNSVVGQGAVILAAIFYAWSAVFARRVTQHVAGLARGAAPLITATIFMWITAPFIEKPFQIPTLPLTWMAALWLGILGTGLAVLMFYYLIHEIGPTRATLVTYLSPIGGVFFGVIFLHEYLSWQLLMGTLLIVGSLVVVNWKPAERVEHKQVALKSR